MTRCATISFPGWVAADAQWPQPGLVLISDGFRVDLGLRSDRLVSVGLAIEISHWMAIPATPWIKIGDGYPREWEYVLVRNALSLVVAHWHVDEDPEDGPRRRWYQAERELRVRRWFPLPAGPKRVGILPFVHQIAYEALAVQEHAAGENLPSLHLVSDLLSAGRS